MINIGNYIEQIPSWLRISEHLYVITTDLMGHYTSVNPLFAQRFAYLSENFLGQNSMEAIYIDDHQIVKQTIALCLAHVGKSYALQIRKPDKAPGHFYWTQWEFSAITDAAGLPVAILCIGHDMTEQKESKDNKLAFFSNIITYFDQGYYCLDKDWRFVNINSYACKILGLSKEDIIGVNIWEKFPALQSYRYPTAFRSAFEQNTLVQFQDYRPDLLAWFNCVAYPDADVLHVFFNDISKEKLAIKQLEDLQNNLRAISDSTTDANVFLSKEKKILLFNRAAAVGAVRLYGKEMLLGASFYDFVLPVDMDDFDTHFEMALKGRVVTLEKEIFVQKNTSVWFLVSYYPVRDSHGAIIGVTFNATNIDSVKKATLQVAQQKQLLSAVFQSANDAHIITDSAGKVLFFKQKRTKLGTDYLCC